MTTNNGNFDQPPRPTRVEVDTELRRHIQQLAGPEAEPRPEQIEAVSAVVADGRRTLLVARTGFGKSAVYFSATRMLRDRGWGPTVVVSPLLALMRDQVASAAALGLRAETINSSNLEAWASVEEAINLNEVDLLLISPERLANAGFRQRVFATLLAQPFALVCDEAHCISDWGHDFRPDYLRLRQLLADLPPWTPVLATTATANQRVTDDVASQLGSGTLVLRTSLDRESLHLSSVDLENDAQRLAWLAREMPQWSGSGIVYCLTQNQAEQTAQWLLERGVKVAAYTGATENERRQYLEDSLRRNELKALVATSALGMGFDKGDMAFCVHLGLPPTPVAYYQQIGRAGRAIDTAQVIALPRPAEDAAVWRWFDQVSLPPEELCQSVLAQLDSTLPVSIASLETSVNLGRSRLGTLLKILEVEGAVRQIKGGYIVCESGWEYNREKAARLRALRRDESEQMVAFRQLKSCRLRFLREALDDPDADDCRRCDCCRGSHQPNHELDETLVAAAQVLLQGGDVLIEPRRQWPTGLGEPRGKISPELRAEPGRSLARRGDGGWDSIIEQLFAQADQNESLEIPDDLVRSFAGVLKRWDWPARPRWICPIPSRRRPGLLAALADSIGELGKIPVYHSLRRIDEGGWQADQSNSAHQVGNIWGRFDVDQSNMAPAEHLSGPVLLLDDEVSSRWTLTVCSVLLRSQGAGPVLPAVLRTL